MGEPTEVKQATQGYKDEMDILGHFVNEHCLMKTNARTSVKELYERYSDWCKDTGEYQITQRKFNRRLEERGFVKKRSGKGGNTEFHGIGLLSERFTEETEQLNVTEPNTSNRPIENHSGGMGENASESFSASVPSVDEYIEEEI